MSEYYKCVILPSCDCFVDDDNNLHILVDNAEIACEYGCGFNQDVVYAVLEELGII